MEILFPERVLESRSRLPPEMVKEPPVEIVKSPVSEEWMPESEMEILPLRLICEPTMLTLPSAEIERLPPLLETSPYSEIV